MVALRAAAGDEVEAGDTIMILETMKMETQVKAPYAGRVREILATVNSQVDAGGALLRMDKIEEEGAASTAPTIEFAAHTGPPPTTSRAGLRRPGRALQALSTGYDVSGQPGAGRCGRTTTGARPAAGDDDELPAPEFELLTTFTDISELSRNRPAGEEEADTDERVHSPREHFHAYLQSLDLEREGLPESFHRRLSRALGHYGITDLEPSTGAGGGGLPHLPGPGAGRRPDPDHHRPARAVAHPGRRAGEDMRRGVGRRRRRLITATQWRYPVVGDLARNVRFEIFDQPVIESSRAEVYDEVRAEHGLPGARTRTHRTTRERIDTLVRQLAAADPAAVRAAAGRAPACR